MCVYGGFLKWGDPNHAKLVMFNGETNGDFGGLLGSPIGGLEGSASRSPYQLYLAYYIIYMYMLYDIITLVVEVTIPFKALKQGHNRIENLQIFMCSHNKCTSIGLNDRFFKIWTQSI